jgi:hypothetical protein
MEPNGSMLQIKSTPTFNLLIGANGPRAIEKGNLTLAAPAPSLPIILDHEFQSSSRSRCAASLNGIDGQEARKIKAN